jgi:hypothetical protein
MDSIIGRIYDGLGYNNVMHKNKFFEGLEETNMFKEIIGLCDHYKIG